MKIRIGFRSFRHRATSEAPLDGLAYHLSTNRGGPTTGEEFRLASRSDTPGCSGTVRPSAYGRQVAGFAARCIDEQLDQWLDDGHSHQQASNLPAHMHEF